MVVHHYALKVSVDIMYTLTEYLLFPFDVHGICCDGLSSLLIFLTSPSLSSTFSFIPRLFPLSPFFLAHLDA
jgi:hypothetical protein